ncbi:hypothetical protein ACFXK0_25835 [Nocardia sp. NPDC059177]|uniref:hypothetical protein n=1 Tax=Nocardia sp. NPDC059177 TaxID=3346759 RepID=UPI00367F5986
MKSRTARPIAIAALVLTAGALSAGTASAAAPAPVSGSVEVCLPVPLGPLELSLCL